MIIDIAEKILKMMGYDVMTARSGRDALELYKENQVKIDLVRRKNKPCLYGVKGHDLSDCAGAWRMSF